MFHAARDSDDHHHGVSVIIIMMVMNIQIKSILIVEILEILCPSRSSYHHQVLLLIETSSPIGFILLSLYKMKTIITILCVLIPPLSDIPNQCLISDFCDMRGHHFDDHVDHDHRGYDHYYYITCHFSTFGDGTLLWWGCVYPLPFTYNLFPILKQNDGHNDQQDPCQLYSFFL